MSKKIDEVRASIAKVESELASTQASMEGTRGPVQDATRITIIMVNDLLGINKELCDLIEANHSDMISKTDPRLYGSQ